MSEYVSHIRVRYAETDQMGVVYHANYLVWMEVARTALCKHMGVNYRDLELEGGILLAVTESNCRYLSAARYDDEVAIRAKLGEANRRFMSFDYELTCEGRRVATGITRHIFLRKDPATGELRPTRLPDRYAALFGVA